MKFIWQCDMCVKKYDTELEAKNCAHKRGKPTKLWICEHCSFPNYTWFKICRTCGANNKVAKVNAPPAEIPEQVVDMGVDERSGSL
jgi:hypothetical protein